MSSFAQALHALLAALGRPVDPDSPDLATVQQALAGQGLTARIMSVAPMQWPEGDWVGMVLRVDAESWLALRPGLNGWETLEGRTAPPDHGGEAVVLRAHVESLREILPFLRRHRGKLTDILLASLLINLLALLFPLFSSFVYDKVLGNGITETLWALAIGLVLAIALDFSLRGSRSLLMERFAVTSEADIDHAIFRSLLAGNVTRVPSVGLVLDKYKQILSSRDFLSTSYLLSALDIPFLVVFLIVLGLIAGPLALVPMVIGLFVIGCHVMVAIPVRDYERLSRQAGEQRFALLADTLTAREAVFGGRLRTELSQRWRKASVRAGQASGRSRYWHATAQAISVAGGNAAYVAVIVAGAHMVEARSLTSGGLLAATMLTGRAMAAITSVVLLVTRYREFRHSMSELDALLPPPAVIESPPNRGAQPPKLQVTGLGCRLRAHGPMVLDGLSLKAGPGEIIGIAGHPGAGKTTLLRILAGILSPDHGLATLNGYPITGLSGDDISATIGYKPQEPSLFEGTIESNILAGRPTIEAEMLETALQASGLSFALERGELTLDTEVGPRGAALSGGQRQMVALARALLAEPPFLLLDEPNTGLDAPLEKRLADYLLTLSPGRLILVSTHSRMMLSACSRIVIMDGGKVITDGSREKVMGLGS